MTSNRPPARNPLGSARPSSARALLLVLIGEFVWPLRRPVWSSTLLAALADLDVEPNAARKALQRTAASGLMEPVRDGRRVRWSVTARGDRLLRSGWERTYGWHTRDRSWDGRWLSLSVTVPESRRRDRHHLQNRLLWAGLGSPVPGQWLTPHWERGEQVAELVGDLDLTDAAFAFVGTLALGDPRQLVRAAWDLDQLGEDYGRFLATYTRTAPSTDRERFRARVALVQDWRRFPYLDPDLPDDYLPEAWPGAAASQLFTDRYSAWKPGSDDYWAAMAADS